MKKEVIDFINTQRLCVLSIEMLDGSPHGSSMHFAYDSNVEKFFLLTDKKYKKFESIASKDITRASIVIGFNENNKVTFQSDGNLKIIKKEEFSDNYFIKFPENKKYLENTDTIFLLFSAKWWRYTDWTSPDGKKVISSEDK